MHYKARFVEHSFNTFKKYIQQHLTHSYHLRPMINFIKNSKKQNLIGVEIGTLHALNAQSILQNLNVKHLYLVDPYTIYDDGINTYQNRDKDYEIAKQRMKPFRNKVTFIVKTSEDAICDILTSLDFVYIDGNHDYEHVKQDLELYYPLVRSGGVIGGHDFRADCEGLCRAVLEFADEHKLKLNGWVTDYWFVKP